MFLSSSSITVLHGKILLMQSNFRLTLPNVAKTFCKWDVGNPSLVVGSELVFLFRVASTFGTRLEFLKILSSGAQCHWKCFLQYSDPEGLYSWLIWNFWFYSRATFGPSSDRRRHFADAIENWHCSELRLVWVGGIKSASWIKSWLHQSQLRSFQTNLLQICLCIILAP